MLKTRCYLGRFGFINTLCLRNLSGALQVCGLALTCWFLMGCSSKPDKVPPTLLTLDIKAGPVINANKDEKAAPLQIRLYELKSKDIFIHADFLDLYGNDSATLQGSLVRKHHLPTVWPGMNTTLSFQLDSETAFVAILGEFSDYLSAVTKLLHPVTKGKSNHLVLHIEGNRLSFSTQVESTALQQTKTPDTEKAMSHRTEVGRGQSL
ncbi:type VI secretion system lipoprotein TssJ [Endozoicomonas arenosclerae]|uniref:type VI secretion system lipoprotein TssJ n=1 Tax=Endozoicomonas arenosclerae TaxID=1633495 RepID=UPI000783721B|nr:type VI secretion system lipoprotein TssJ [Endozoicomonas arenosclerae]